MSSEVVLHDMIERIYFYFIIFSQNRNGKRETHSRNVHTDMKIAKQFSRFRVWFLLGHLQFSYERNSGIENFSGKNYFSVGLRRG